MDDKKTGLYADLEKRMWETWFSKPQSIVKEPGFDYETLRNRIAIESFRNICNRYDITTGDTGVTWAIDRAVFAANEFVKKLIDTRKEWN